MKNMDIICATMLTSPIMMKKMKIMIRKEHTDKDTERMGYDCKRSDRIMYDRK